MPAVFLLELVRPFAYLCSQALRLGAPVMDPWTGRAPSRAARLLDDPNSVDALIDAIEAERGG